MEHSAVVTQPESQPASMQPDDKENTPPEGRSTPTLDERASSSQESLPCAVGLNFIFKWSPGLTPFCFRSLYCTYIVTNSAQTYGLCVFFLFFSKGPRLLMFLGFYTKTTVVVVQMASLDGHTLQSLICPLRVVWAAVLRRKPQWDLTTYPLIVRKELIQHLPVRNHSIIKNFRKLIYTKFFKFKCTWGHVI